VTKNNVMPAKAGIHSACMRISRGWMPAFAGMTIPLCRKVNANKVKSRYPEGKAAFKLDSLKMD
jgi:hypothetical protein